MANRPKVVVNGANGDGEQSAATQAIEVVKIIFELLLFLVKYVYYYGESIFRMFVPREQKSVQGEIVLITGAGHGIGKELALQYAKHGATVVAWDINGETNNKTVQEINKKGYPKAYGYVCNVSNRENVFETVAKVRKDVGDITIVVNNAGIMPTHKLLDHTKDEIERIMGINVLAHFWIIQATLPRMIEKNQGHIVALSSMAGLVGLENLVPYCASKFAVRGMMESIYQELKLYPNCQVKVTIICPYMVDTGLCKRPVIRFEKMMKMLTPSEVATEIISAQRRNVLITTLPSHMLYMNNLFRCAPIKCADAFKDVVRSGLESDL